MDNKQRFIGFLADYSNQNNFSLIRKDTYTFNLICGEKVFVIEYCDIGRGKEFVTITLNSVRIREILINPTAILTKEVVYTFLDAVMKEYNEPTCTPTKQDDIRPAYYQLNIKGADFDVFDLVRAINTKVPFSFELATALQYVIRLKEYSIEKRVKYLQKAVECINREIQHLQNSKQDEH